MTAKDIAFYLENNYFVNGCKFIVPNIFYFGFRHETDLLVIKNNGSMFDIEIKISRSDYFADFKKRMKHEVLETGHYVTPYKTVRRDENQNLVWYEAGCQVPCDRPNRFYYAVPEGLIKVEELPAYAGLYYILPSGQVKKIKEGKQLHKGKIIDFEKIASKFYWMWKSQKPVYVKPRPILRSEDEY